MAETRIAISNQKGGAGKTTTAINVGGALAHRGHDILLVDLDPQGHATEGLGFADAYHAEGPNLLDVLVDLDAQEAIGDLVREHSEMDCIPAHEWMINAEDELQTERRRELRLKMALDALDAEYDFVLLDCPPNLGILVDNAILAAGTVLIPAEAKTTSIRALEMLFTQLGQMERAFDTDVDELGLVANEVEHDNESHEMMDWFRDTFDGRAPVWEIRKRVALQRAWNNGVSIFEHAEECDMEDVYLDIARHLEDYHEQQG